jgi:hypothetical protein
VPFTDNDGGLSRRVARHPVQRLPDKPRRPLRPWRLLARRSERSLAGVLSVGTPAIPWCAHLCPVGPSAAGTADHIASQQGAGNHPPRSGTPESRNHRGPPVFDHRHGDPPACPPRGPGTPGSDNHPPVPALMPAAWRAGTARGPSVARRRPAHGCGHHPLAYF